MSIVPLSKAELPEPWSLEPPPARLPEPTPPTGRRRGLWIDPVRFLALIDGLALASWACAMAHRVRPACRRDATPMVRRKPTATKLFS